MSSTKVLSRFYSNSFALNFLMFLFLPVALLFTLHGAVGYTNFTGIKILGFLMLCVVWVYFFSKHGFKLNKQIFVYFYIVFLLCIYAMGKEIIIYGSADGLQFFLINLLCLMLFYSLSRYFELCPIFLLFWCSFVISLVALYLFFFPVTISGLQFGLAGANRMIGPFSTPNRFAEVPAVGAIVSFFLYSYFNRRFFIFFCVFFILIALLAGSKGVLVPLFVSLILGAIIFSPKNIFSNLFYVFFAFFVVVTLAVFNSFDLMQATRLDIILEGERDLTSGRTGIWEEVLSAYASADPLNAIFGHGVNGFYNLHGINPHSSFLLILFDYGLLLLVFYVMSTFLWGYKLYSYGGPIDRLFFVLLFFGFMRGIAMPNYMVTISFSMLAYWAALGWLFSKKARG